MRAIPVQTPHFSFDGRGPTLRRWIHDEDLFLPGSNEGFAPLAGGMCGAIYDAFTSDTGPDRCFVVFHGMQVLQIVPEEVHSYWHRQVCSSTGRLGVFRIEESGWLASFSQRHLDGHAHFVLEWYDDIVEVICRDLVFGRGEFEIARVLPDEPRLGYAYFRHALAQEKLGHVEAAIESWQRYIACAPHVDSIEYAQRCLTALREQERSS